MSKVIWKAGTMIYPVPAVMVSCGDSPNNYNIITISWTGTINTDPAMCYISVRPSRHSYEIIKRTGEFIINLTTKDLAKQSDWCGVKSGRDIDKFKELKLSPQKAQFVKAPLIAESPLNIECKVKQIIPLGSHDMFISEVLAVHVDENLIDKKTGALDLRQTNPLNYVHGSYYETGAKIGKFGFSVQKKKKNNIFKPKNMKKIVFLIVALFTFNFSFSQKKAPAIVIAASKGNISKVESYIKKGKDINAKSRSQWSAISYAVNKNNYEMTKLLLDHNADVNNRINTKETPLLLASKYNFNEIAYLLIQHKANVEAKDIIGFRAIHWAAKNNNKELIIKLLDAGANINSKNIQGRTALDMAAPKIKDYLRSKGAKTGQELI